MKKLLLEKEHNAWNKLQIAKEKRDRKVLTQLEFNKVYYTWKAYNDLIFELDLIPIQDEDSTLIYHNGILKTLKEASFE